MQQKSGLFPDPLLKKSRTFGGVVETTPKPVALRKPKLKDPPHSVGPAEGAAR